MRQVVVMTIGERRHLAVCFVRMIFPVSDINRMLEIIKHVGVGDYFHHIAA